MYRIRNVVPLKTQRAETKSDLYYDYGVLYKTTATNNNINDTYNQTHRIRIVTTPSSIALNQRLQYFRLFLCPFFEHTLTREAAHYELHIIAIILAFFFLFRLFGGFGGNA